jgi:UDP-glucose:(heptosyl)LPS alpha-1,3-glucosyltransferase
VRLALLVYHYSPHGGLQRDIRLLAAELVHLGHQCRVYCSAWLGAALADGVEVRRVPGSGCSSRLRQQRFLTWVHNDLASDPVDGVIGFNRMPGLDIYFAADDCYLESMQPQRGGFFGRSAAFRQYAAWESAIFAPTSTTQILLLSAAQRDVYERHYHTPPARMHLLPPGMAAARRAPPDAPERRKVVRASLGLEPQELTLLFVGSRFFAKGLDRAIVAFAQMRAAQPSVKSRFLVVGQDKPRRFQRQARKLGIATGIEFLGGRDDVAELMLGADLLVHPARNEAAGVVLLEALAAGLPVVTTDVCGYATHVKAARAGILLGAPFAQEQLDRAVLRYIDGVFRADCRGSAQLYARNTDLYSLHRHGAALIAQLIGEKIRGGLMA